MPWNYRVFVEHHPPGEDVYTVRSAFYDGGEAIPHSWSARPVAPQGSTADELRADLAMMTDALSLPVLAEGPDSRATETGPPVLPAAARGDGDSHPQGGRT